jgi:cytochrome bd-type quinol oxidase subunit 1/mono/diheme cytochrome c family protein
MNFPVWDVAFGAGLLMALVAGLHVFVSHFAVGGGLFLVLTERKARRNHDEALLEWLKAHTRFFVLLTVVFGAVSGVGIWFTISLISPTATSNLIHIFVWGWAIEWVFFFLEITSALLYLYGWDKMEPKQHEWFGWVYFITAFASMVVINGIITFMLTPGHWIQDHEFWTGFFNPTFLPSLFFRFCVSLALAGIYALITASVQKDAALKTRIVRWGALWTVPSLLLLPVFAWWYIRKIPVELWASARGAMPTGTHFALLACILLGVTLLLALVALARPGRLHLAFSLVVAVVAFGAMDSFEFVRESVRKPYVIENYLYANSLYSAAMPGDGGFTVDKIGDAGVLKSARWVSERELTGSNQVAAGHEIFRVECESCHTPSSYRGLHQYIVLRQWDQNKIRAMLGSLYLMQNGVMPPFAGTDTERDALTAYLSSLQPPIANPSGPADGKTVFEHDCGMCHQARPDDHLFTNMPRDTRTAVEALKDLPGMFPVMPDLKLSEDERQALVQWVNTQRLAPTAAPAAQGGN